MINAWSLAAEILEGTFDETYPIIQKDKSKESLESNEGCEDTSDSQHG